MEEKIMKYAFEARRLIKLSGKATSGLLNGNIRFVSEYYEAKTKFMMRFGEESILNLPNIKEREDLRKLLRHETPMDKAYQFITSQKSNIEFDEDDLSALASEQFYSWFSGEDYVEAMINIDRIFLGDYYDEDIEEMFAEGRRCFAFQQYRAAIMMCRLVLEKFAVKVLEEIGKVIKFHSKKDNKEYVKFSACFEKLDKEVGGESVSLVSLYKKLCDITHGRDDINDRQVEILYRDTVEKIEGITRLRRVN
jgi:hypothetical protein